MRFARLLAVLIAAAVLAAGVAACGGGGDGGSGGDAMSLIRETFGPDHPIRSGKLDLSLNLDLQGLASLSGPVALRVSGPFQSNGKGTLPSFDVDLDLAGGGTSTTVGLVSTGKAGYLTLQGLAFDMGPQLFASFKKGYEQASSSGTQGDAAPSLGALGVKPINWLQGARKAGTEDIGGTQTDHITSAVNVPRFLDDLNRLLGKAQGVNIQGAGAVPKALTPQQLKNVGRAVKSAKVDLWVGKSDRTLRKLALDVRLDVPQDVRSSVGGLQGGRIAFQVTIADLNARQRISAPPSPRPISELDAALKQLGGQGTGGGSATGGTATTPQPSSASPDQQKYLDCLRQAETDVAKIQSCASLLPR